MFIRLEVLFISKYTNLINYLFNYFFYSIIKIRCLIVWKELRYLTRLEILSPKVDFVFKRIFGNENNPRILISFLNAVIKPQDLIKSVQIMNTDIEKESIEDKFSRLDIKAKTNKV